MASPLLEAGAIDGARGILINITGSSSLKLSEVNAASSLIQSSAHEDANIIFGAVLDENMGEEVKLTVIATGFRDQMPERRKRMLDLAEAPMVSEPLVSVPVEAPKNWLQEPAALATATAPPRFMSQDDEEEEEPGEGIFFSEPEPAVVHPIRVAVPIAEADPSFEPVSFEREPVAVKSQLDEMDKSIDEPAYTPLPRDYATELAGNLRGPGEELNNHPTPSLFPEANEESERDLDVPAFMRRSQF